ncbi:MAG: cysteine peptidase family C39 domain-containing protein, partial [Mucilaginibacter sp.]
MPFPHYKQFDQMDCGPTCLRMVAKHYGRNFTVQTLRKHCEINKEGVSLLGISDAAGKIGFRSIGVKLSAVELKEAELPCILHWRQNHFVVLYKIKNHKYYLADPASGLVTLDETNFSANWQGDKKTFEGIALLLTPSPLFYQQEDEKGSEIRWSFLLRYLVIYRKLFIQLLFGLAIGSILQLITPFLTQSIVDIGINTRNLNFVYIILFAQIALIIGQAS